MNFFLWEKPDDLSKYIQSIDRDIDSENNSITRWQKKSRQEYSSKPNEAANQHTSGTKDISRQLKSQTSRAERRRLIKSQILAEGDGEEVRGYRRRHG